MADHAAGDHKSRLEAFAGKQRLLLAIYEEKGRGVELVNDQLISADDSAEGITELIDLVISVAGSRTMDQGTELLAELLILKANRVALRLVNGAANSAAIASKVDTLLLPVDVLAAAAKPESALGNFRDSWQRARHRAAGQSEPANEIDKDLLPLALAVASDDVDAAKLRLPKDVAVNALRFPRGVLPANVQRRPNESSLLALAAGAGSVKAVRFLLESHTMSPTREALKQALATGSPELIAALWGGMPGSALAQRGDLLEVAADFHQAAVFTWLFRGADPVDRERSAIFALEHRLADALLWADREGLVLCSDRARELVALSPVASGFGLRFGEAWLDLAAKAEFWSRAHVNDVWDKARKNKWELVVEDLHRQYPWCPREALRLLFEGECVRRGAGLPLDEREAKVLRERNSHWSIAQLLEGLPRRTLSFVVAYLEREDVDPRPWSGEQNLALALSVLEGTYAGGGFDDGDHNAEDAAAQLTTDCFQKGDNWNRQMLNFLTSYAGNDDISHVHRALVQRVTDALGGDVARGLWDWQRMRAELGRHPLDAFAGRCALAGGGELRLFCRDGILVGGPDSRFRPAVVAVRLFPPVVELRGAVFSMCEFLREVTLPDTVRSVGTRAFQGCAGLGAVVFPHGLRSIGRGAFEGCSALSDVVLPTTLEQIGDRAFGECSLHRLVVQPMIGLRSVGVDVFGRVQELDIAGWSIDLRGFEGLANLARLLYNACLSAETVRGWPGAPADLAVSVSVEAARLGHVDHLRKLGEEPMAGRLLRVTGTGRVPVPVSAFRWMVRQCLEIVKFLVRNSTTDLELGDFGEGSGDRMGAREVPAGPERRRGAQAAGARPGGPADRVGSQNGQPGTTCELHRIQ
jgi:hypothetical protein